MPISRAQQGIYRQLVDAAYTAELTRRPLEIGTKEDWRRAINVKACGKFSTRNWNNADFDAVVLELAIIAEDDYWIGRCSTNDVRQLQWLLKKQFIPDLEFLEKRPIGWEYIQGICAQAKYSSSLMDCPKEHLENVLMMVDTHIRRLAKRNNYAIADLPSGPFRKGIRPANKALAIYRHDHHHRKECAA